VYNEYGILFEPKLREVISIIKSGKDINIPQE